MSSTAHRPLIRSAAALLLAIMIAAVTAIGLAPAASAHTDLSSSDPADGAELSEPPTAVTLVFAQSMQEYGAQLVLTGPDGQPQPLSAPVFDGATVRSEVGPLTLDGGYTIAYRIVSTDGHPIQGALTFQLTLPPAPATTAPSTTPPTPTPATSAPEAATPAPTTAASSGAPTSAVATSAAEPGSTGAAAVAPAADNDSMSAASVWAIVAVAAAFAALVVAVLVVQRRRRS